jgi:hypothetical protein
MAYYPVPNEYPYANATPYQINNPGGDPYADVPPYQGNYPRAEQYADAPLYQGDHYSTQQDSQDILKNQTQQNTSTQVQESATLPRESIVAVLCKGLARRITVKMLFKILFILFLLAILSVIIWIFVMIIQNAGEMNS